MAMTQQSIHELAETLSSFESEREGEYTRLV